MKNIHKRTSVKLKAAAIDIDRYVDLPSIGSAVSAGLDIKAHEKHIIPPSCVVVVGTNLKIDIPDGFEVQVRPRSGMSIKYPNYIANSPGTIDSDYIGEIKIIVVNNTNDYMHINQGDRIAQLILKPVVKFSIELVDELDKVTERGSGGFGSTGI